MKGPKRYPPPESRAASKHVWSTYQESRASATRAAHDKLNQEADRHNAFVENAKKHGIPISKKKK